MSFDPYAPYGPVVETTARVVTWNVWGRYGEWARRQHDIERTLGELSREVVCLVEIDGPRGPIALFVVLLDFPLDASAVRQAQVPQLGAIGRYPDRRFDYVLSAWPRRGAVGHPVHCQLVGVVPANEPQLSDHYGVVADLRY